MTYGDGYTKGIVPIEVAYTSGDETIYTPDSDGYVAVVGLQYVEGDAHNLTFKSGSTTLVTFQQAANGGISHPIGDGILVSTYAGEALKISCTEALSPFVIYVQEYTNLKLGK